MRILANVTSSLLDDYNKFVARLTGVLNGDTYFTIENASDIALDNTCLDDYDLFINLFDDDDDIMDTYNTICDYVKANDRLHSLISYYTEREYYTHERVYYTKDNVNRTRLHRFMIIESIDDIVFDVLVHASLYFGADVGVCDGMLRFKNYNVLDMGEISYLRKNPLLKGYHDNIISAREDEKSHASIDIVDDRHNLREIEDIHNYMDKTYDEYNRYLSSYIACYSEVLVAWGNKTISTLDYIFVKEYFRIGHLTSISSCFNRNVYNDRFKRDEVPYKDAMNILKLIVHSMSFADKNVFVVEILNNVMRVGKRLELKYNKDSFFHYHEHEFAVELDQDDEECKLLQNYIDMVETGVLEPNAYNIYTAYMTLSNYYRSVGKIEDAIVAARHAFDRAVKEINMLRASKLLCDLYSMSAEYRSVKEYVDIIIDNVHLIDRGYHDDYLAIAEDIISVEDTNESIRIWTDDVIKRVHECKYVSKLMRYTLYVNELESTCEQVDKMQHIKVLDALILDMCRDFYISPIDMYINIYRALTALGKTYELIGDAENATNAYKRAYIYVTTLEEVDDVDADASFIQYRLGDINLEGESAKSYRLLTKSEKSTFEYITHSARYIDYYKDLLIKILTRQLDDGKKRLAEFTAKQYLTRLVSASAVNEKYLVDIAGYCQIMSEKFSQIGAYREEELYHKLASNYSALCKKNNLELD